MAHVRRGEPAGRRVRERAPAAQRHPPAHRGAGAARHPALRHQPPAPRVARLRQQDPGPLPRDGLHPARGHRRQQAAGHHAGRGQAHPRLQAGRPRHLRLGDPRPPAGRRRVRQVQRALGQLHQPHPAQQDRPAGPRRAAPGRAALRAHLPVPVPRARRAAARQARGTPRGTPRGSPRGAAPLVALGALGHQHPGHPHLRGAGGGSGRHRGRLVSPENGGVAQREPERLPRAGPGGQRAGQGRHGRRHQIPPARRGALLHGHLPAGLRLPPLQPVRRLRRLPRRLHPPGTPLAAAGDTPGPPRPRRDCPRRRAGHGLQAARQGRGGQKTPEPRGESSAASERHPRNLHPDLLVLEPPARGSSGSWKRHLQPGSEARSGGTGTARAGTGDLLPRTFPEGHFASSGSERDGGRDSIFLLYFILFYLLSPCFRFSLLLPHVPEDCWTQRFPPGTAGSIPGSVPAQGSNSPWSWSPFSSPFPEPLPRSGNGHGAPRFFFFLGGDIFIRRDLNKK